MQWRTWQPEQHCTGDKGGHQRHALRQKNPNRAIALRRLVQNGPGETIRRLIKLAVCQCTRFVFDSQPVGVLLDHGLETGRNRLFDIFILTVIMLNVVALVLESVQSVHDAEPEFFRWFEIVSVAIFTVEYVLRIWSCVERPGFAQSVRGRLRFARTPFAVIDLLAILPFLITCGLAILTTLTGEPPSPIRLSSASRSSGFQTGTSTDLDRCLPRNVGSLG